jgi:hypothetical protein
MLRLMRSYAVGESRLYMGELSECDEVNLNLTEYGGGKNWQSVGAITTAALTNQGRGSAGLPTTLHTRQQYQQSISMKFHWPK